MNKYLEKIAVKYNVGLTDGDSANLSRKETKRYVHHMKNPGFGSAIQPAIGMGLGGYVGHSAGSMIGEASGNRKVKAVLSAAGMLYGANKGIDTGIRMMKHDAIDKTMGLRGTPQKKKK